MQNRITDPITKNYVQFMGKLQKGLEKTTKKVILKPSKDKVEEGILGSGKSVHKLIEMNQHEES